MATMMPALEEAQTEEPLLSGCPWCGPIPSHYTSKICPTHLAVLRRQTRELLLRRRAERQQRGKESRG